MQIAFSAFFGPALGLFCFILKLKILLPLSDWHCLSLKPDDNTLQIYKDKLLLQKVALSGFMNEKQIVCVWRLRCRNRKVTQLQSFCPKQPNCYYYHSYKTCFVPRIQMCVIWAALGVISRVQKLTNGIPAQLWPHMFKVITCIIKLILRGWIQHSRWQSALLHNVLWVLSWWMQGHPRGHDLWLLAQEGHGSSCIDLRGLQWYP